jgi:hypothetical protein
MIDVFRYYARVIPIIIIIYHHNDSKKNKNIQIKKWQITNISAIYHFLIYKI